MRHFIQICNLATGSKVVSWTGALNSQLQLRDLRNHCVRIYALLTPLSDKTVKKLFMTYCDLRGRIKGTARALYPVFVERALWPMLSGHKAR